MADKSKVFASYKYWDDSVYQYAGLDLIPHPLYSFIKSVTPRSYLNALSTILSDYSITKWEDDDNDLSQFKDDTIKSKLKDNIPEQIKDQGVIDLSKESHAKARDNLLKLIEENKQITNIQND